MTDALPVLGKYPCVNCIVIDGALPNGPANTGPVAPRAVGTTGAVACVVGVKPNEVQTSACAASSQVAISEPPH